MVWMPRLDITLDDLLNLLISLRNNVALILLCFHSVAPEKASHALAGLLCCTCMPPKKEMVKDMNEGSFRP
jgi:hypothetical protein